MNGTHQLLDYADDVNIMDGNIKYPKEKQRSSIRGQ
jgi:hypothetical protein